MVNLARVKQIQERFDRATYLTVYTRGEFGYNDPRKSAQLCFVEFYKMLDSKLYDLFAEAHPTESGDYIDYQYPVNDHKSLEDRLEAASKCQDCLIEQRRPHLHFRPAAEPGDAARAPAAGQHDGRGLQVLYCTVVCCTVLYCTLLYCTVLYCTELIL